MNPRQRLLATLAGEVPDCVPVYTQIPFVVTEHGFRPGPIHGYEDEDPWREQDPAYWRLVRRMEGECDNFYFWRPPCMGSDPLFVPPARVETLPAFQREGRVHTTQAMHFRGQVLTSTKAVKPGTGHSWQIEHWCKTPADARLLLDIPWKGISPALDDFHVLQGWLGDAGLMWVTIPSPLLPVCRLFDPADFLVFARTERELIHELMQLAAERIRANLMALLELGVGPIIRFGGAEHATPPLMSPRDFDELVAAYDAPLVALCKATGRFVAYHCHGHLRHALMRLAEMGVDQTDPVETVPDGDVTLAEARQVAGEQVTLSGNIQMREIYNGEPAEIEARVRQLIEEAGPRRLVVTTTGTPLEAMTARVEANYHALIDATRRYGSV